MKAAGDVLAEHRRVGDALRRLYSRPSSRTLAADAA